MSCPDIFTTLIPEVRFHSEAPQFGKQMNNEAKATLRVADIFISLPSWTKIHFCLTESVLLSTFFFFITNVKDISCCFQFHELHIFRACVCNSGLKPHRASGLGGIARRHKLCTLVSLLCNYVVLKTMTPLIYKVFQSRSEELYIL